jgi:short subunit dehydrogenase-like uncharacterized protein
MSEREFDLVVWGASGFTGRLVAAHILYRAGTGGEGEGAAEGGLRWALGGRNRAKLEEVRAEIGREVGLSTSDLPLVVGDSGDEDFMDALARRTRVVCTTVGPYAKYGSELVAACARNGTHYCDLTGEVQWMQRMIDEHDAEARESGARIVHTAGFDSIPSDLGVYFLQREMRARHGVPAKRIACRVADFSGGASGGTVASMMNMMEEAEADPKIRRIIADPYALNPKGERRGPDEGDRAAPAWDEDFESWTAPFVMAGINTRVVRRSNALLGQVYGDDFRYDEAMLTGKGPAGFARAAAISAGTGGAMLMAAVGPLRRLGERFLPAPGEGPSRKTREAGHYTIRLHGEHPEDAGKSLDAVVRGDMDPGYGSTSKMLGEVALCLAQDELDSAGGISTPAACIGDALLARLPVHAGVRFSIVDGTRG